MLDLKNGAMAEFNKLSKEQQLAYTRYIRARDRVKLVKTSLNIRNEWIPHRDYVESYRADGEHHPVFEPNPLWEEYKQASLAWWKVEPERRDEERMRMSRGDYGRQDSWEDVGKDVKDVTALIKSGDNTKFSYLQGEE
jgi:hypothetical protein